MIIDPLGLLTPFINRFKRIFQEICQIKLSWDEVLPLDSNKNGCMCENAPQLKDFEVHGQILNYVIEQRRELYIHTFSDASAKYMGQLCILT